MKKANIIYRNQEYKGYILIENMSELIDYFYERMHGIQKESISELVDFDLGRISEIRNEYKTIKKAVDEITSGGLIVKHAKIFGQVQRDWIKIINEGEKLVISPFNGVSYFCITDKNAQIEIIQEKEKYDESDIKITKYEGGKHFYAKVGLIDVVIDGEVKWNARWVAIEKSLGEKLDLLAIFPVVGNSKDRVNSLTGREIEEIWKQQLH